MAISEAADFIFNGQTGYTLWAVCALLDRADAPPFFVLENVKGLSRDVHLNSHGANREVSSSLWKPPLLPYGHKKP